MYDAIEYADGGRDRFRDLRNVFANGRRTADKIDERRRWEQARDGFDFEAWMEAGCPPDWSKG
ncbi:MULTISPECIES: hypothetical protein [Halomicrobium]|uniref:Uncharacterized protein n=2 Tax=Halomicrobium mukohataei TaxID=57705 RepID=C7NWG1_HALMD|nr:MULTISPECIES: hypothetical protein [Halomicrobium]ACV46302.1 conserved hypothetical protein [Halomicrobium mukohataei DSM 12286]QCD64861.1 hypothetical protein E5139_04120 [Halomicrobium mukohataei]QFR19667.1 hypothetical protein GBQ70_04115 [Halomicrobium sp. ZPS1]